MLRVLRSLPFCGRVTLGPLFSPARSRLFLYECPLTFDSVLQCSDSVCWLYFSYLQYLFSVQRWKPIARPTYPEVAWSKKHSARGLLIFRWVHWRVYLIFWFSCSSFLKVGWSLSFATIGSSLSNSLCWQANFLSFPFWQGVTKHFHGIPWACLRKSPSVPFSFRSQSLLFLAFLWARSLPFENRSASVLPLTFLRLI